jgi:hypothetical protein
VAFVRSRSDLVIGLRVPEEQAEGLDITPRETAYN